MKTKNDIKIVQVNNTLISELLKVHNKNIKQTSIEKNDIYNLSSKKCTTLNAIIQVLEKDIKQAKLSIQMHVTIAVKTK